MSATTIRRLLRLAAVNATSGVTVIAGTLTCTVALVLAVTSSDPTMLPGWADPFNLILSSTMIFAPVSCGAGALTAGRLMRSGALALAATAPNGRWRSLALTVTVVLAWMVLAIVLFALITLVTADLHGPLTGAMWLMPTQALLVIAVAVSTGVAVGSRISWFLTGPLLAVALYLALLRLDYSGSRLSPVYTGTYYETWYEPNARLLVAVCLVLLSIVVGLCAWGLFPTGWIGPTSAAVVVVGCVAMSVVQLRLAGPEEVQMRTAVPGTCASEDEVQLCVLPDDRARLAPALLAFVEATKAASPLMTPPDSLYSDGVQPQSEGARPFSMPPSDNHDYLDAAVNAVLPSACDDATQRAHLELWSLIEERIQRGSTIPELGGRSTAEQPLAEQRQWANDRLRTLERCT